MRGVAKTGAGLRLSTPGTGSKANAGTGLQGAQYLLIPSSSILTLSITSENETLMGLKHLKDT